MANLISVGYKSSCEDIRKNITKRLMLVKKGNAEVCKIFVDLKSYTPLFQESQTVLESKKMSEIPINKTTYNAYSFEEYIPYGKGTLDEDFVFSAKDYVDVTEAEHDALANEYKLQLKNLPRFVELFTVNNPLTQVDYTFFLDRYFQDIFYLSGLNNFISPNVKVNPKNPIIVRGIRVGGYNKQPQNSQTHDLQYNAVVYNTFAIDKSDNFRILNNVDQNSEYKFTPTAFSVTYTRDLPPNIANTNYPVFYDKLTHIKGTEIQLARQDTIPLIWISLGKFNNFCKAQDAASKNLLVPNYIIYNSSLNNYRIQYNGDVYDPDNTNFAVALPIY